MKKVIPGGINLASKGLNRMPDISDVDEVHGYIYVQKNQLTSLAGSPKQVRGPFVCSYNNLKNLVGAPAIVHGSFNCSHNPLESLEGVPKQVTGNFFCDKTAVKFTKEQVRAVCQVGGTIHVE